MKRQIFAATKRTSIFRGFSIFHTENSLISVNGPDSTKFLQGMTTNDVTLLSAESAQASAILTPKGKVFSDVILYRNKDGVEGAHFLIETSSKSAPALLDYLKRFKLRAKVKLDLSGLRSIVATSPQEMTKDDALLCVADPRSFSSLFTRCVFERDAPLSSSSTLDSQKYKLFLHIHGVAEGLELADAMPMEANLDLLHYLHHSKGCYVGQELIARTQHKGVIRKRLVPFFLRHRFQDIAVKHENDVKDSTKEEKLLFHELSSALFEEVVERVLATQPENELSAQDCKKLEAGHKISTITSDGASAVAGEVFSFSSSAGVGLAMMRLDALKLPLGTPLVVQCEESAESDSNIRKSWEVQVYRPAWWPLLDEATGKPHMT